MRVNRLIIHVLVIVLALLLPGPFLWLLRMVRRNQPADLRFPAAALLQPDTVQLRCPVADRVSPFVFNSVFVGLASTLASMLAGVLAAYALSRMRSRSNALSLWIIANRIALPTAFAIPYFLVYRELDLIDTRLGLVIIYLTFNISLVIWLMRSFF